MKLLVDFAVDALTDDGTVIIFCSFVQWGYYHKYFLLKNGYPEPWPLVIAKPPNYHCGFNTGRLKNLIECAYIWHKSSSYYRLMRPKVIYII